jgi:hypothetical protein
MGWLTEWLLAGLVAACAVGSVLLTLVMCLV